jgi:hypothetical protein
MGKGSLVLVLAVLALALVVTSYAVRHAPWLMRPSYLPPQSKTKREPKITHKVYFDIGTCPTRSLFTKLTHRSH